MDGKQLLWRRPPPFMVGRGGANEARHTAAPVSALAAGEQLLADAAERALHAPRGKIALALHLSRLTPPAPHAHHTRVALSLLQDSAERHDGHVFAMRNGDIVLLCSAPVDVPAGLRGQPFPQSLQTALTQLFGATASDTQGLATLWRLETQSAAFRAYVADRQAEPPPPSQANDPATYNEAAVEALESLLTSGNVSDLLAQQTAIQLRPGKTLPLAARLVPLFRELTFARAALTQRHDTDGALDDPFLFRHFAATLDARMLEHVLADLAAAGRLTRPALALQFPLNLNMTLESIVSPAFARLVQGAKRYNLSVGVEISLMEATADLSLMEYAATLLSRAGFTLLLDGLDHIALAMTHPAALQPDLVKLIWSPRMLDLPPDMQSALDAAIARLGPGRVVLHRAESEAALAWGQARGITRYQGFFLDAVQAAARIAVCHSARACSLSQCTMRAGTLNPAQRSGCGNPGLLDMAPSPPTGPAHAAP